MGYALGMRFVALRELKINPSGVIDRLSKEDVVVTRRGKPAAALLRLDEDLLEEFVLAHRPTLAAEADAARREYMKKGGIGHGAMKDAIRRGRRGG